MPFIKGRALVHRQKHLSFELRSTGSRYCYKCRFMALWVDKVQNRRLQKWAQPHDCLLAVSSFCTAPSLTILHRSLCFACTAHALRFAHSFARSLCFACSAHALRFAHSFARLLAHLLLSSRESFVYESTPLLCYIFDPSWP